MSNLRDLIDETSVSGIQTSMSLPAVIGGQPSFAGVSTSFAPGFPGSEYKQLKYKGNLFGSTYNCCSECLVWKPPMGTTFLKFEIWGGGGGGAGTCCCMNGIPAGSGAYAYKCVCTGEELGGCVYEFCIARSSCRSPMPKGDRGFKSFIVGYGLNNFCAEGGGGGTSACFSSGMCLCDYPTIFNQGETILGNNCMGCTHTNLYGVDDNPRSGIPNLCDCMQPGQSYGTGAINPFDMYDNSRFCCGRQGTGYHDLVGLGNTFGSFGRRVRFNCNINPCYGGILHGCRFCAPYFGADGGSRGLPGGLGSPCNHDTGDRCMNLQYIPYPGGLINTRGGWIPLRMATMNYSPSEHIQAAESFGYGSNANSAACSFIPGIGGETSSSEGGNCYNGSGGGSGQVIITYG